MRLEDTARWDAVVEAEGVVRVVGRLDLAQPAVVARRVGVGGPRRVREEVEERAAGGVGAQRLGERGLGGVGYHREGHAAVADRSRVGGGPRHRAAPVAQLDRRDPEALVPGLSLYTHLTLPTKLEV
jgi:hypothetical protein